MIYLYILENKSKKYYCGITGLQPELRLLRHNKGHVCSTKMLRPWKLVYTEEYQTYKDARAREKQIKSWKGGNAFEQFLFEKGIV